MTELNEAELQAELANQDKQLTGASKILQELQDKQSMTNKEISACEDEIRNINLQRTRLQELLTIAAIVIPDEIRKQRDELLAKRERAQRKDITVAEQEALIQEIKDLIYKLPDRCRHPFVLGYPGYRGSSGRVWEDSYPGHRMCMVCGYEEESDYKDRDEYRKLVEKEGRLIKDISTDDLSPLKLKVSIDKVREGFIAMAGHKCAAWPVAPC